MMTTPAGSRDFNRDGGGVDFPCPQCGQRLRLGWGRCPHCRVLVEQVVNAPASVAATAQPANWTRRAWMVIGAAISLSIVSIGLPRWRSGADQPAAITRVADAVTTVQETTRTAAAVDSNAAAVQLGRDERRSGAAAYATGDFETSLARYQAAVEQNPSDADAHNGVGQLLVRLNRPADALPEFDEAVRLDPVRWAYRFNRGRAYAQLNRWSEAAADYRAATGLFPDDYATYYNLGLAFMKLQQPADAAPAFERAVALAPGDPSFLISLGTAYIGAGHPDRAKETFQRFVDLAPDDPEAPRVKSLLSAFAAEGR